MIEFNEHAGGILELKLARPPVNALNPELVGRLCAAVTEAPAREARALVISGSPGLFSAGLDVPELLDLDRAGMRSFWKEFFGLLEAIARSEVPVAVALTGHSPAGGTVMALFADYRVQADGDYRLGLNEVQVGLVVPPVIHRALVRLIGVYPAERHLVAGRMILPAEALKIGLVDELAAPAETVGRAVEWCRAHLALPPHAMRGMRRLCRSDLVTLFDDPAGLDLDAFESGWFAQETQSTLRDLVARLKGKG